MNIRVGILTAPHIDYEQREHSFVLHNVRIGIGFHWDQTEDQEFAGELEIVHNDDGTETAVNIIDLESYIASVICSEMSGSAPLELLKAQAVIARSWVLRNIGHTGHVGYDVCADDHCQRYNGLRRITPLALQAVKETEGQVLTLETICDCRYHKCCGGRTELYSTCWEDKDYPYLQSVECPYCAPVAGRLLPVADYDLPTSDYHSWTVEYTQAELSRVVSEKTGIDFGLITDLIPLHRGPSGRIDRLEIVGTKHREVIGKELRIRQALSPTTLYSSWFDVEKLENSKLSNQTATLNSPLSTLNYLFRLNGKGWGHGVGLCQIGASVMAQQGFTYKQILSHYYRHTEISHF